MYKFDVYRSRLKLFDLKMASFGSFIKEEREKKGWNQTEFGTMVCINPTAISKIEHDKKSFNPLKLDLLAELFEIESQKVKDLFFADKFAKEAFYNGCTDHIFSVAEVRLKYLSSKNIKQTEIKF